MKTMVNQEVGDNNDRKMIKVKRKENSWLLTTKCSTNHANLLVIVASHGSLAITNSWLLQEKVQSMAHEIGYSHSNMHWEQANVNIRTSKLLEECMK